MHVLEQHGSVPTLSACSYMNMFPALLPVCICNLQIAHVLILIAPRGQEVGGAKNKNADISAVYSGIELYSYSYVPV